MTGGSFPGSEGEVWVSIAVETLSFYRMPPGVVVRADQKGQEVGWSALRSSQVSKVVVLNLCVGTIFAMWDL